MDSDVSIMSGLTDFRATRIRVPVSSRIAAIRLAITATLSRHGVWMGTTSLIRRARRIPNVPIPNGGAVSGCRAASNFYMA